MASLKEIMNIDEDSFDSSAVKRDKQSVPRSSTAPDSITSTSCYASPTDPTFASSSVQYQRQSPSSHTAHPLGTETTSPSPGASTTGSRRRSNTSTESMDPPYYVQGHAYGSGAPGSSGGSSRPYITGSGGDGSVKLTPITGRVSRAKKGVPVHICELCQSPKVGLCRDLLPEDVD